MPTYQLLKPHTHRGRDYEQGDLIEVRASTAQQFPTVFAKPTKTKPDTDAAAAASQKE